MERATLRDGRCESNIEVRCYESNIAVRCCKSNVEDGEDVSVGESLSVAEADSSTLYEFSTAEAGLKA